MDLIRTEQFHEIPVRIVRRGRETLIPITDIADGIGYDRSTLGQLLKRNDELFLEYQGVVITTTPCGPDGRGGGPQETVCLNRDGIIALMMILNLSRIKDSEKRAKILQFRKWAIETLGKIIDGDRLIFAAELHTQIAAQHLKIARSLLIECGMDEDRLPALPEICADAPYLQ